MKIEKELHMEKKQKKGGRDPLRKDKTNTSKPLVPVDVCNEHLLKIPID